LKLEYLEDTDASPARVLLLYEATAAEVEAVRGGIAALAGDPSAEFNLEGVPGFLGIDGCSLVASVGALDLGVEAIGDGKRHFRCILSPPGWQRVCELLEPFLDVKEGTRFQYLTEVGPIDWIVSTSRAW
jgi:hypothetical protein